jgi:hypothetical protein
VIITTTTIDYYHVEYREKKTNDRIVQRIDFTDNDSIVLYDMRKKKLTSHIFDFDKVILTSDDRFKSILYFYFQLFSCLCNKEKACDNFFYMFRLLSLVNAHAHLSELVIMNLLSNIVRKELCCSSFCLYLYANEIDYII